jgi:polyferredoxin
MRYATQCAALVALGLIPALGLFRIDFAAGSLMILGRAVSLRDFSVVAGMALVLATGPLLMISTIGTLWCGWACPQNTVSEWANRLTHRLLGSRANVDVEGAGLQVAPSKNRASNWLGLGARFLLAAAVLGILPLLYFLPPGEIWSLVTMNDSAQFSRFMLPLYLVSVGAVFTDIALVRYFLCNYVCLYRIGTLLFRNSDTLHVAYDSGRSADCAKCNYCRVSCVTGIDPTRIQRYDRCINCGACIDACARLHAKGDSPTPGLLRFDSAIAKRSGSGIAARALRMIGWHGLLFLAGSALMGYGLLHAAR